MKIATWNINAGILLKTIEPKAYEEDPNINYFVEHLRSEQPDILCLQEVHISADYSQAQVIAEQLGYQYMFEYVCHPFHMDEEFKVGNAILSKIPFDNVRNILLPYPDFELQRIDGQKTIQHDKYLHIVDFDGFTLANTHFQALHFLGQEYDTKEGLKFAGKIESVLLKELEKPLIFCGDFNFTDVKEIYPNVFKEYDLEGAMEGIHTHPRKKVTLDHVLYNKNLFRHISAYAVDGMSDHKLCVVELEYLA